ncbi:MAG TPA: alpha/beta hydrolase [Vicinamibacterales bacterium]
MTKMFDEGSGPPLVLVQPLQGRWEWMRPSLVALSKYARVISYTLCGDIGSGARMDPSQGFSAFTRQLEEVMERAGVTRAALCGVSFGGVVAAHYAALQPERVSHLIVASSPGPGWEPTASQAAYVARPWLSLPALALTGVGRVGIEIAAALPGWGARMGFALRYFGAAMRFPMLPHLMARRVRLMQEVDLAADCARIKAPTLVITGDASLDRVVPVASTKEYVNQIRGARYAMMDRTGHLGSLTQPDRFARIVGEFVNASSS